MLIKKIDISRLVTYSKQIEEEMPKKRSKKDWVDAGGFSHQRFDSRNGCSQQGKRFFDKRSSHVWAKKCNNPHISVVGKLKD